MGAFQGPQARAIAEESSSWQQCSVILELDVNAIVGRATMEWAQCHTATTMPSMLLLLTLARLQQPLNAQAIYKKVSPSVMTLQVVTKAGDKVQGTAFLAVKDGVAVTAWHVIREAATVTAKFADGQEFEASGVVDRDEKRDVALIRVKVADRPLLSFSGVEPEVGSKCFLIGAPKGLEFSISDGIIGQIRSVGNVKELQFTCPASPGNSGGPLVDDKGAVLGVCDWQLRDGQNLNFAIASTYAKGLDGTLATQQWADVKPTLAPVESNASAGVPNVEAAAQIISIRLEASRSIMAAWDLTRESTGVRSNHLFIPPSVGLAIDNLTLLSNKLRRIQTSNRSWNEAISTAADNYAKGADGIQDMRNSCTYAMAKKWDNYANSLYRGGEAKVFGIGAGPWAAVIDDIKKALPESTLSKLSWYEQRALFGPPIQWFQRLGIVPDARYPQFAVVAFTFKGSTARSSGIEPADQILMLDSKNVTTWEDVDAIISKSEANEIPYKVRKLNGKIASGKIK